jgi:hypothetical protein
VRQLGLSRLHPRFANIRRDALHKLTTILIGASRRSLLKISTFPACVKTTRLPVLYWIAASASFGAGYSTRQRCAAGVSWLPIGFSRRPRHARRAVASLQTSCSASMFGYACPVVLFTERDPNGAFSLEKLGPAEAESTRRDMAPLPAGLRIPGRAADEPRTLMRRTCAHIEAPLKKAPEPLHLASRLRWRNATVCGPLLNFASSSVTRRRPKAYRCCRRSSRHQPCLSAMLRRSTTPIGRLKTDVLPGVDCGCTAAADLLVRGNIRASGPRL